MSDALLLMGHGSRDPEGVDELLRLVRAVQDAAPSWRVEAGALEFPTPSLPTIQETIDRGVAAGVDRLVAIPILLHQAGHSKHDMPDELAAAITRHPTLELRTCASLGMHSLLLDVVAERAGELEAQLPPVDPERTALLLVGRGASDPEANADFFKVGRLIWERHRYGWVECCFVSLADPRVAAGIERCIRLGADRVLVLPYFLNTGVLVKRIGEQARTGAASIATSVTRTNHGRPADWSEADGVSPAEERAVEIAVGAHMGVHPNVVEVILEHARGLSWDGPGLAAAGLPGPPPFAIGEAGNGHARPVAPRHPVRS